MFDKEWAQEQFNTVVKGFASQRFMLSLNPGGGCMYRYGSRRCAIGWLIPDDKYKEDMEGNVIRYIESIQEAVMSGSRANADNLDFLCELQNAHDELSWEATNNPEDAPNKLKENLRAVAVRFQLELPEELR